MFFVGIHLRRRAQFLWECRSKGASLGFVTHGCFFALRVLIGRWSVTYGCYAGTVTLGKRLCYFRDCPSWGVFES